MVRGLKAAALGAALLVTASCNAFAWHGQPIPFRAEPKEIYNCWHLLDDLEAYSLPVIGVPGLRILKTELLGIHNDFDSLVRGKGRQFKLFERLIHSHEIVGSAYYTRLIRQNGETLVMVPTLASTSVPGFDGVIFSRSGKPVANYSLKTAFGGSHSMGQVNQAIAKAEKFSQIEGWQTVADSMQAHYKNIREGTEAPPHVWIRNALKIFGIRPNGADARPTRIVLHLKGRIAELPNEFEIQQIRARIRETEGTVGSVTFLKGQRSLVIHAD